MERTRKATSTVTLLTDVLDPHFLCRHDDGRVTVELHTPGDLDGLYLYGTLDGLAALVDRLAGVVRELTERELNATVAS